MKYLLSIVFLMATVSAGAQVTGNVLSIGDSLTAGLAGARNGLTCASLGGAVVAIDRQRSCRGNGQRNVGGWQPSLSSQVGANVFNYGNSGELTSEILARLDASMDATDSQFVLILAGTNDAIRGPAVNTIMNNLQSMIDRVRDRNRIPVIATLPPLVGSVVSSSNANVLAINQRITQLEDIEVADLYGVLISNWSSHTSGDFIHLGASGNALVAQTWAEAIERSLTRPTSPAATLVPTIKMIL